MSGYPRRRYGYGGPTPSYAPPHPRHHHPHHHHHHPHLLHHPPPPPPPPPRPRHRLRHLHPPPVLISTSPAAPAVPAAEPPSPVGGVPASAFPEGTDPNIVAFFNIADQDGNGFIDDKELHHALSEFNNEGFTFRTVRLLMYTFNNYNNNTRNIGPKEFTELYYSLQNWRSIFERFDRDRSGKMDASELREALLSLGYDVSPPVLELLVSKFDTSGGSNKTIGYDSFVKCCVTVKGLTEKFKEKDTAYTGSATFTYEAFMLDVLPILLA